MLDKVRTLQNYKLQSLDGEIGKVIGFYFDDLHWTIRYLVAETGNWLTGRQVLISPYSLGNVLKMDKNIIINLTKKQIEDSPPLESNKPVSRQFEEEYYQYYNFPTYWYGPYIWGFSPSLVREPEKWQESTHSETGWDSHLRSTYEVCSYSIQALDGAIGSVEDFIIDDETWAIRYLIINTGNWWPGKHVLISPQWVDSISCNESKVFVCLSRENIKKSPEYSGDALLTRDYEIKLHQHYNRQGYWLTELGAKVPTH